MTRPADRASCATVRPICRGKFRSRIAPSRRARLAAEAPPPHPASQRREIQSRLAHSPRRRRRLREAAAARRERWTHILAATSKLGRRRQVVIRHRCEQRPRIVAARRRGRSPRRALIARRRRQGSQCPDVARMRRHGERQRRSEDVPKRWCGRRRRCRQTRGHGSGPHPLRHGRGRVAHHTRLGRKDPEQGVAEPREQIGRTSPRGDEVRARHDASGRHGRIIGQRCHLERLSNLGCVDLLCFSPSGGPRA